MARGQLQPVHLVEVADTDRGGLARAEVPVGPEPGVVSGVDGPDVRFRRARGAWRWWPIGIALVAVLAFGGLVTGLQARQRAARLALLPGVVEPMDPSLPERWRVEGWGWGDLAAVGGDDILVFGRDVHGVAGVLTLDGATGERAWTAPFPEVGPDGSVWCLALVDDGAHVVCIVVPGGAADAPEAEPAEPARLVALSLATGRRAASHELRTDNAAIAAVGSDVVVTEVLPDGRAAVTLLDPLSGQVRWEYRSREALRTPSAGPAWLYPVVQHGVIVANGPVTWAFGFDGTVLGEWHLEGGDWAVRGGWGLDITVLPDGRFAVGESGGVGLSDDDYGTVSATDARDGFAIPGPVMEPTVDDGSADGVLLVAPRERGGIVALDSGTGEQYWSAGAATWGSALVVDRRVIMVAGRGLEAFDARSGRLLWHVDVAMGNHARQVLTDGRVVLVPRFDPEVGPVLTAVDPADGREQWSAPLPARVTRLAVVQGQLLVTTEWDLVAVG